MDQKLERAVESAELAFKQLALTMNNVLELVREGASLGNKAPNCVHNRTNATFGSTEYDCYDCNQHIIEEPTNGGDQTL